MRCTAWYVHFPADAYALGPFRFERPVNEREARAHVRDWDKISRLPQGTELWPAREPN